jgi:hypothetical protein
MASAWGCNCRFGNDIAVAESPRRNAIVHAAPRRRRHLERRAPPAAARAGERPHADVSAVAAALLDQRWQRHREDALAREAAAADAVAVGVELAESVEHD